MGSVVDPGFVIPGTRYPKNKVTDLNFFKNYLKDIRKGAQASPGANDSLGMLILSKKK